MAMQANTVLDYVELRLAPPRTRCELFVSANGVTEKLAAGFLKPFLTHLRAMEEQVAQGCNSVRLGHPQTLNGNSWFTKGTLERFVRFLSTPEVLERVKSIEDELVQLEQVRSIQASSLFQADEIFAGLDEVSTIAGGQVPAHGNVYLKLSEEKGSFKMPRRISDGVVDRGAEASKVELLKAMDMRVRALQQEQNAAFDRALAAGFCIENMADIISFSEHFGAERLRTACVDFMEVFKSRHETYRELDNRGRSSYSNMLLQCDTNHDEIVCQRFDGDMSEASLDSDNDRVEHSETALMSAIKETRLNGRGSGGIEVRKRWGPPENIRTELFINQNETDSASSSESSNGASVQGSPEIQRSLKKDNMEQSMHQKTNLFHSILSKNMSSAQGENDLSAGHTNSNLTQSLENQADGNKGEPLFEERYSMSYENSQSSSSVPNCNFSSQEASVKVKSGLVSDCGEGNGSEDSGLGSETLSTAVVEPTRRLSVQDAISLFENKRRRDSGDSVGKHRICKQENSRASLEGAGTCSSGSMVLKRWDSGKSPEASASLQKSGSSSKLQVAVLGTECTLQASAIRPGGSGILSSDSLQGRNRDSLAQTISGAFGEVSSNSQSQPSTQCASAKVESMIKQQSASSENNCDGDWRKQFKLQLEKSLAKDCFARDSVVEGDLREHKLGVGIGMQKKNLDCSKMDLANGAGLSVTKPLVGSESREEAGSGTLIEERQVLPIVGSVNIQQGGDTSKWQSGSENSQSGLLNMRRTTDMKIKEDSETSEGTKIFKTLDSATKQNCKRDSLGTSLIIASDHDMHADGILPNNEICKDDKVSDGSKGRLYEQYRKLRDAKLMEDQDSKRVEREAKLRIMEENLRRRKAEMDARVIRLSKNSRNQADTLKVEAIESNFRTPKKEEDGDVEVSKSVGKDEVKSNGSLISPPSTPCTSKEVSNLKPPGGRKAGAVSQKGATPPRSSNRPIPSVSPKVTPKSTVVGAGNPQKSMASSRGDNPLAKSVPCFANLRKENTKPLPGRPLGSARVHPKNGGSGRIQGLNDTPPLEANGNLPVRTNFSNRGPSKEDQRNRSSLLRKSYATVNDLKTFSTSSDDGILAPRKSQKEATADPVPYNKLRQSAIGSLQEAKPFLRKGRGIGPGTGPGVTKQKVSTAIDMTKSSDEDIMIANKPEENDKDGASEATNAVLDKDSVSEATNAILDGSVPKELCESEKMDIEDDAPMNFASPSHANEQAMRSFDIPESNNEAELDGSTAVDTCTTGALLGTWNDNQRASLTISLPIDIQTCNEFAEVLSTHSDSCLKFDPDALSLNEEDIEALSQRDEDTVGCPGSIQNQFDEGSMCASSCATSPPPEHSLLVSSLVPPPPSSNVVHHEQLSPHFGAKLESPMGSPAILISPQAQHLDATQLHKKWIAIQKPIIASQPKESVRGFKRLLKFGRKSRSSEIGAADCISASTTSEGDDESEEQSRYVEEVSSRGMLFERSYNHAHRGHTQIEEEGSAQSLRTSIPTPPTNFKMRDDHLGGGTMLRAPRSFFSLSSFRNKGSEGRSRSREHGHG